MVDTFRSRVDTNVVPMQQRDPRAFESGVGEGLQRLGGAAERAAEQDWQTQEQVKASEFRIAEAERRRRQAATIADGAGRWAEVQAEIDAKRDDLKLSSAPGAPGYAEKAEQIRREALQGFMATLGDDPEVAERFAPMVATYGARTGLDDRRWQLSEAAKHQGASVGKWSDTTANGILSAESREDAVAKFSAGVGGIDLIYDGLDLPGTAKEAAKLGERGKLAVAFLDNRLQAGDWQGGQALLKSGQFDFLDPEVKSRYLKAFGNAEQVAAHQAEIAAGEQRQEVQTQIREAKVSINGGAIYTPGQLASLRAKAEAAGVPVDDLAEFDILTAKSEANRQWGRLVDVDGGSDVLRAKRESYRALIQSGKASRDQQFMASQLDELIDRADSAEAARATAKAGKLGDLSKSGPEGKIAVMRQLTGSPETRWAAAEKIERGTGLAAVLPDRSRQLIFRGREVLKARPKDFGTQEQIDQAARWHVGGALAGELGESFRTMVGYAWNIYAELKQQRGEQGFDRATFKEAMLYASGAKPRANRVLEGGIDWVNGKFAVELPDFATAAEFERLLARQTFGNAIYANGAAVQKADVLANYRPVAVGDDAAGAPIYQFKNAAGERLRAKGGGFYSLTVRP